MPLLDDAAFLPEDRDVAEERKRVLECQPVVESMVGSPLILHELSKVSCTAASMFFALLRFVNMEVESLYVLYRFTAVGRISWL